MGLETNDIIKASSCIILTQLHDGIWRFKFSIARTCIVIWIFQSNGFHRSIKHGFNATFSHNFNRHTAFKILFFFKRIQRGFFCGCQSFMESHEFFFGHRAVEVSSFAFIVARFEVNLAHINSRFINDRRCCVVEIESIATIYRVNFFCQGIRSQRSRRDNRNGIVRDFCDFITNDINERMIFQLCSDTLCIPLTVNSHCSSSRYTISFTITHNNGIQATHFFFEKTDCIG